MRRLIYLMCTASLLAVGCGDSSGDGDGAAADSSTGPATTTGTPNTTTTADTTAGPADTTGGPPPVGGECILEDNDCDMDTQKCMPWSEEADRIPDEARCCPLQDNPDLDGERCTVDQYDGSCIDSCEENTMCLVDTPDSLEGYCRSFCDPGQPSCNGGDGTCKSFFELIPGAFTVPLCMDRCDPLLQDCSPSSWHCIPDTPTPQGQSGFICVPPPPDEPLAIFEPCGLANDCAKGLVCVPGDRVPGCADVLSCCTAYCSLSEGDTACQDIEPTMQCVDWMSPDPDWTDVGVCALPP